MAAQKYCVKWKNRFEHFQTVFADFIDRQVLCDVTLVSEGRTFKAHQFVLAGCSSYFKNIFQEVPASEHPIIFLRDVTSQEIKCLLDYVYRGETIVQVDLMPSFLKVCESLYIQGLCENENCRGQTTDREDNKQRIAEKSGDKSSKSILTTKDNISPSLVTETVVQNNDLPRKRRKFHLEGKSNQSQQFRHISNTKRKAESGLFVCGRSNNYPDKQFYNNQEPQQNLSPSIMELTQVDSSNIESCSIIEGMQRNVIDSSPYSQHSIIFSLSNTNDASDLNKSVNVTQQNNSASTPDKSMNASQDSVMILSEANKEVLDISDDDSGMKTSGEKSGSLNANRNRDDVDSKENFDINRKRFFERLNLRPSACLSDDSLEEFQLVLSPDVPVEEQTDESDVSEVILKRRTRNRHGSVDTSANLKVLDTVSKRKNAKKVCESVSLQLDDKMEKSKRLQVILTKVPPYLRSNNYFT